jgi:hypothetical protein
VCPFRIFIQPYSKAHARPGVVPIRTTSSASTPPVSRMLHTNFFYEKALFVKPTWRLFSVAECNGFRMPYSALCASIRTFGEPSLFGGSVHRM